MFHHFCLTYSGADVKEYLCEFAKIGAISCCDEYENNSLYYAIENKVNGLQLVYGMVYNGLINIDVAMKTNKLGHSILCKCINLKNIPILKLLISFGFNPFQICQDCKSTDKDIQDIIDDIYFSIEYFSTIPDSIIGKLVKTNIVFLPELINSQEKVKLLFKVSSAPVPAEIEKAVNKFNFKMDDYKTKFNLKKNEIESIEKVEIIDKSQLSDFATIGEGGFSTVHKATYIDLQNNITPVAIKSFKNYDDDSFERIYKEVSVHQSLQGENILKLIGISKLKFGLSIIVEKCDMDLKNFISCNQINFDLFFNLSTQMINSVSQVHNFYPGSEINVYHRDIKLENWLIKTTNGEHTVFISDFGLSRSNTESNGCTLQQIRGTNLHIAPECYKGFLFSCQSDIFSVGISLYQLAYKMVYGKYVQPYHEYQIIDEPENLNIIQNTGLIPTIPPSLTLRLLFLMMSKIPERRPSIKECIEEIQKSKEEYESDRCKWDNELSINEDYSLLNDQMINQYHYIKYDVLGYMGNLNQNPHYYYVQQLESFDYSSYFIKCKSFNEGR
ncbi:hypothetical protein ACTFIY_004809 [Dictyostelium cf. discoideum]